MWIKMKKPTTLAKFYKKEEEFFSVKDDPSLVQNVAKSSAVEDEKSNDTQGDKKNAGGLERKTEDNGKAKNDNK